jgi:hypothetical protein
MAHDTDRMVRPATDAEQADPRRMHAANRLAWDEAAERYEGWLDDAVNVIRSGGVNLFGAEVELIGDLHGHCRRAIHLQCAGGLDTLSLWNLGAAEVVGIATTETAVTSVPKRSDLRYNDTYRAIVCVRTNAAGDVAQLALVLGWARTNYHGFEGHQMRTAITIVFALLSATAAQGQSAQSATKYAVSGRSLKLSFYNSTNPDCSSPGRPTIRIIRAPEYGRVTFTQTADFPSSRSQCHQRRVSGTAIYYSSQRGFAARNALTVRVRFSK